MAGIAALKSHLVKAPYNKRFQPSKVWQTGPEVLFIVQAGDSAVTTVTI